MPPSQNGAPFRDEALEAVVCKVAKELDVPGGAASVKAVSVIQDALIRERSHV